MNLDPLCCHSLCVLRLSAIGDVCHAVAMVQAIQRQYPHLKITWVVGKIEYQLLQHIADIEFIIFDKSLGWRSYFKLYRQLKGRKFDILLQMQVALRASIASLAISAKVRLGFDRARAKEGQWLFTNRSIDAQRSPHVLEGFMGFAKKLGVQNLAPSWQFSIPKEDSQFAKEIIGDNQRVLIICAAASKAERNWLPKRYAAVAGYALSQGFRVLLCGGPAQLDKQLAAQILQDPVLQDPVLQESDQRVENWVGKTSLTQLLALLKQASMVLAPDTGPGHMAVTQGTPVLGLYAHSNPGRTGPYLYPHYAISVYDRVIKQQLTPKGSVGEPGGNTTQIPWGKRAKGDKLMELISVKMVTTMLDKMIKDQKVT